MRQRVTKYFDQISLVIFHWQWKGTGERAIYREENNGKERDTE